MIIALTSNAKKFKEYQDHFGLYGISSSLVRMDPSAIDKALDRLVASSDDVRLMFRETSDLFDPKTGNPIYRPYRVPENQNRPVINKALIEVTVLKSGEVQTRNFEFTIEGKIDLSSTAESAFDWDDVFVPTGAGMDLHQSSLTRGKVSARSIGLDAVIAEHLPFRSNRAFKYGRANAAGLVDLNHWPIGAMSPISFEVLPIDVLRENPYFKTARLTETPIGRMMASALSEGAHFRAAGNRREWLYWAPGINAGIPLTPKEDPAAELIYLAHDFAHYAMPDLLINTEKGPQDRILIAHRMISETLAMVSADMFVMDAFLEGGVPCDAGKHGIYQIYRAFKDLGLEGEALFEQVVSGAVEALLAGDDEEIRSVSNGPTVDRFMAKYSKFALADYEWTMKNIEAIHEHQDRQERWIGGLPAAALQDLGLKTSSEFIESLGEGAAELPFKDVLRVTLRKVLDADILPMMRQEAQRSREDVPNRSIRRYLVGQTAFYARYPDACSEGSGKDLILEIIRGDLKAAGHGKEALALMSADIESMQNRHQITPLDALVYRSVFPIVRPHYVSYANPNVQSYEELMQSLDTLDRSADLRP